MVRTRSQQTTQKVKSPQLNSKSTPKKTSFAPKIKDKVASFASPRETEREGHSTILSEDCSPSLSLAPQDDTSVVTNTSSSSTSSGCGLPLHIQKQLASDIEASGGIKAFDGNQNHQLISRLCNQREELYGKRGDNQRLTIQKKVYRWVLHHRKGEYTEKVLNRFGVSSFANLRNNKNHPSEGQTGRYCSEDFGSDNKKESEEGEEGDLVASE